jgi:hypothetical protein
LWQGRHLLVATLRKMRWQADQADEVLGVADVQVVALMAGHGANIPGGRLTADAVTVAPARRVTDLLQALPAISGLGQVVASLRSRPWAAIAQITNTSRVMISSDQNG